MTKELAKQLADAFPHSFGFDDGHWPRLYYQLGTYSHLIWGDLHFGTERERIVTEFDFEANISHACRDLCLRANVMSPISPWWKNVETEVKAVLLFEAIINERINEQA